MPVTALCSCFILLGQLVLILVAPASVVLLLGGEKRTALRVLRVPIGIIAVSILLTVLVFAPAERVVIFQLRGAGLRYSLSANCLSQPNRSVFG